MRTVVHSGVASKLARYAGGGIQADLAVIRLEEDRCRVVCGGDTGHRDYIWMLRMAEERGSKVRIDERSDEIATPGVWGPNARATLQKVADDPAAPSPENFPFAFDGYAIAKPADTRLPPQA